MCFIVLFCDFLYRHRVPLHLGMQVSITHTHTHTHTHREREAYPNQGSVEVSLICQAQSKRHKVLLHWRNWFSTPTKVPFLCPLCIIHWYFYCIYCGCYLPLSTQFSATISYILSLQWKEAFLDCFLLLSATLSPRKKACLRPRYEWQIN